MSVRVASELLHVNFSPIRKKVQESKLKGLIPSNTQ